MKRLLLPIVFSLATACVTAQQVTSEKFSLTWTKGLVVFKTSDTLHCDLRFNQTGDKAILQVAESGHTITVPVRDVKSFSFYDAKKSRHRTFMAFRNPGTVDQEFYMEKIYFDNHFSILNHKTMEVPLELNFSRFVGKPVKTHKKYLLNESTGEMLPLSRENLFSLLEPKRDEIVSYVKARHIRFKRISDFINVFEYHNSL
jgi:hypothetical protein